MFNLVTLKLVRKQMWEWLLLILAVIVGIYILSSIKKVPGCSACSKNSEQL